MKPQSQKTNMVKYLDRLTADEKAVICYLGNNLPQLNYDLPKTDFHQGLLPFIDVKEVVAWLKRAAGSGPPLPGARGYSFPNEFKDGSYKRYALQILTKMADAYEDDRGTETFLLQLNDQKVYRRFGSEPERGLPLTWLPKVKVTVGQRWSLPKKAYLPDKDVLVSPCVTLKLHGRTEQHSVRNSMWEVKVNRKCRPAVENWLLEVCR